MTRKSKSGKVNALRDQLVNKMRESKAFKKCVCETQGNWWEGVPSRRLRKLPVLAGQIKGKLLIFISEKNAGVGTKKSSSSSSSSLSTDGTQLNETACKYVQIRRYIYI